MTGIMLFQAKISETDKIEKRVPEECMGDALMAESRVSVQQTFNSGFAYASSGETIVTAMAIPLSRGRWMEVAHDLFLRSSVRRRALHDVQATPRLQFPAIPEGLYRSDEYGNTTTNPPLTEISQDL